MARAEVWLSWMLRIGGVVTGSAFFTIFLSESAMASTHASLGLGDFPSAPLTSYLTRSLSAMYAFHGVILWALAGDVRRHRPVIRAVAWATLVMGVTLTGIDLMAGLPTWWTIVEGPSVVLIGAALIALSGRVESP